MLSCLIQAMIARRTSARVVGAEAQPAGLDFVALDERETQMDQQGLGPLHRLL
jgi:hypothetical protein